MVLRITDLMAYNFVLGSLTQIFRWLTISKISSWRFLFSWIFLSSSVLPEVSELESLPYFISALSLIFYYLYLFKVSVNNVFSVFKAAI